jgi:hypothetical protein
MTPNRSWHIYKVTPEGLQCLKTFWTHDINPESKEAMHQISTFVKLYGFTDIRVLSEIHFNVDIRCEPI